MIDPETLNIAGSQSMSNTTDTIWPIEPHTQAKHEILRRYLGAWLPILSTRSSRIVYIDGFAGPGRYSGGEEGSPIVALRTAIEHSYPISAEIVNFFIEEDEKRKDNLVQEIAKLNITSNINYNVIHGKFDETMTSMLDDLDQRGYKLAPTFAFVDPFGWSDTPFEIIARLLRNQHCEVLINFMYESISRFVSLADQSDNFDRLFGAPGWRAADPRAEPSVRRQILHDAYEQQLKKVAKFVRSFEMRNSNSTPIYYLFFATNNPTGLEKMKAAMWGVDPSGGFRFSDATDPNQLIMFGGDVDVV